MELPGWAYLTVGIIVTVMSGLVYKLVPKSTGEPNLGMVLFFFIGMIFIIIGVIKTFFKKMEVEAAITTNAITNSVAQRVEPKRINVEERKFNRIEQQINQIYAEQNAPKQQPAHQTMQHGHTNQFARTHQFQGVQQPIHHQGQHVQHQQTQKPVQQQQTQQGIHQHYTIVPCVKCGTKNYSTSNFCHGCGNRLR